MKKNKPKREKRAVEMLEPTDEIVRVLTQIHERGGQLIEAFQEMDHAEMVELLPVLRAMSESQKDVLSALKEISFQEVVHAEA